MTTIFENATIADLIGIAGFGLYVLSYMLLTIRAIDSACVLYFTMNLFAASFVLYGLTESFNLASAMIQFFWISISVIGIVLRLSKPQVTAH